MSNTLSKDDSRGFAGSPSALPALTQAQQYLIPTSAAEVPGTPMPNHYVQTRGLMACVWDWPLINLATAVRIRSGHPNQAKRGRNGQ
ncbi:MAG TPA: hypothetical protein VF819_07170 [Nitrospira sp.]